MPSRMRRRLHLQRPAHRQATATRPRRGGLACLLAALPFFLGVACGTPESTPTSGAGDTGSVGILVTDAPSDDFTAINLTVTEIQLLGGPEGTISVFSGRETFDLLRLRDVSELFSLADDVPAGSYSKIRLLLEDIELVEDDGRGGVETHHPNLPGNGKLDLQPRGRFHVRNGEMLVLQIDIDAEKSIHVVRAGSHRYVFRPVVFVKVLQSIYDGRLVRIHGLVKNVDPESASFELCHLRRPLAWLAMHPADESEDDRPPIRRCVDVGVLDDASIFDRNGDPATFADITEDEQATVVGHVKPTAGHLQLLAELVLLGQRGTFTRLRGVVASELDGDDRFDLEIAPGQGFVEGSTLAAQLFESTRIFSRAGMELSRDQIELDLLARVTGVIALSNEDVDLIKTAVLVLDLEGPGVERLRGVIREIDDEARRLELAELDASGSQCVDVPERAGIFIVDTEEGESAHVELEDLDPGDVADVYGRPGPDPESCFVAGVIIAFPDVDPGE